MFAGFRLQAACARLTAPARSSEAASRFASAWSFATPKWVAVCLISWRKIQPVHPSFPGGREQRTRRQVLRAARFGRPGASELGSAKVGTRLRLNHLNNVLKTTLFEESLRLPDIWKTGNRSHHNQGGRTGDGGFQGQIESLALRKLRFPDEALVRPEGLEYIPSLSSMVPHHDGLAIQLLVSKRKRGVWGSSSKISEPA